MKTAISLPDELFEHVDRAAAALGMSRSALIAAALARYLQQLEAESLTRDIDAALERIGPDDSWAVAADAGRRRLARDAENW